MAIDINKYSSTCKNKSADELAEEIQEMQNELINDFNDDVSSVFDCDYVPKKTFFPTDITENICDVESSDEDGSISTDFTLQDSSQCSQEMLDEIKKYGEKLKKKSETFQDVLNSIAYLDEWLKNLEPIYYYHKTKISQNDKLYNILDAEAGLLKMTELYTIGTGEILSAINKWSRLLGVSISIKKRGGIIFKFNFRFQYKDKLKEAITNIHNEYDYIGLPDFLNSTDSLAYYSYDSSLADGYLYNRYFNLMEYPIDNFFTPEERGLVSDTENAYKMDIPEETKDYVNSEYLSVDVHEDGETKSYFVGNDEKVINGKTNYQRYQDFYNTLFKNEFDNRCQKKYDSIKKGLIYKTIYNFLQDAAKDEVKLISKDSDSYKSSKEFVETYEKIETLKSQLYEIKKEIQNSLSQEKIKEDLKNVDCFDIKDFDDEVLSVEPDISYGPNDPSLPTLHKMCYWVKFCECATLYNLTSPYQEIVDTSDECKYYMKSMRYWPVGFVCPSPIGLIKVPLPVIYAPLFCLSTPMGTLVLILGLSGIFPTIYLMYFATDGSISFAATAGCSGVSYGNESFNFTSDDEDNLLTILGIDKSFKIPLMTPEEMLEYELERAKLMADKAVGNSISKLKGKMDEAQYELYCKYQMMKQAQEGSFNINEEIDRIRRIFNDALDYINLDEYALDKIEDVEDFVDWCLSKIRVPVIQLPEDLFEIQSQNPIDTIITNIQDLLSMNIGLQGKTTDLRKLVINQIDDMIYSKKVDDILHKLPEKLVLLNTTIEKLQSIADKGGDLGDKAKNYLNNFDNNLGNFELLKEVIGEIIDLALESLDPNIFANDQRFLEYLEMVNNTFNQYNCKTQCSISDYDASLYLGFLKILGQTIQAIISALDFADFLKLLSSFNIQGLENGVIEFARSMVLSIIEELIYKFVPEIPIIDVLSEYKSMKGNAIQAYGKIAKVAVAFSAITADSVKDFLLSKLTTITIDLNIFINLLRKPILELIDEEFGKVEDELVSITAIRELIRTEINDFFTDGQKELQPYIEAYNFSVNTFKMLKKLKEKNINFTPQDLVLRTKECAQKLANSVKTLDTKEQMKKLLGLDGIVVCDVKLSQLAIMAMKEFGVSFNNHFIIAAVCCLAGEPGKNTIRAIHPISFSDDIPPYERLNLQNPLFCLFLDSFCAEARKYGGYNACYLPIG